MTTLVKPSAEEAPTLIAKMRALRSPSIVLPTRGTQSRADEIATITHELRNSLGVVLNAARVLRAQQDDTRIDGARVLIERHVLQMSRHIDDLMGAVQIGNRSCGLRLSHVDLRLIVRNALDAIAADLARRKHRLFVNLPEDALWLHADAGRLEQVFSNLLINAAKYTPDGGEIWLTVERQVAHASVRIRDSGIGISAAFMPKVFDMFVQAEDGAARAEGGRGIGLAVVRNLVELHGGTVAVASPGLGLGAEFTVLLPRLWATSEDSGPAARSG